jgi:Zn-dependent peptidase ImmA (M78 family)
MLRWARERARVDEDALVAKFPKLLEWERRESLPTFKQLEDYARATLTPVGYLFLAIPPVETVPIPDFRTIANQALIQPSPNLLETIFLCQQRQAWYLDYARSQGNQPIPFIGSVSISSPIKETAALMRQTLDIDLELRRDCRTWEEALRHFIAQADVSGIMVMCSGVVLNNNYRKLDPEEFRGFALADSLAPLVFINGADSKSAQMFTLAHELAHLWLGQSALSNADATEFDGLAVERWCNQIAAEFLIPLDTLKAEIKPGEPLSEAMARHARRFKVSTLVVLRRLYDAESIPRDTFREAYLEELARLKAIQRSSGGGNFYLSQAARVSKRFARALVESTLEGRSLYRDAMQMLGVSKVATFNELGRSLGYPI